MDTSVKDKTSAPAEKTGESPVTPPPDRKAEIDELLRIKKLRKFDAKQVPCPSCTVPVEITINRCPFCESDIAAETALARETMRRLRELSGELDMEHAKRPGDDEPHRRGFFERLKYLFEGDPRPDPNAQKIDLLARRVLMNVSPGDTLRILDEDGPWLKVKTAQGDIGWVYSTVRKDG